MPPRSRASFTISSLANTVSNAGLVPSVLPLWLNLYCNSIFVCSSRWKATYRSTKKKPYCHANCIYVSRTHCFSSAWIKVQILSTLFGIIIAQDSNNWIKIHLCMFVIIRIWKYELLYNQWKLILSNIVLCLTSNIIALVLSGCCPVWIAYFFYWQSNESYFHMDTTR
jgi:hypothetical protein